MNPLGTSQALTVTAVGGNGAVVDAGSLGSVPLPHRHCPTDLQVGDLLTVFIYLDARGQPVATTQTPTIQVGEFAYLRASDNTDYGTFMDWGLDKDLLVPFGEQHRPMQAGRYYIVHAYVNGADGRITGSSKIDKFLDDDRPHAFKAGQPVDLLVANTTDLGFKAIVDNSHWGILYKNEVEERLSFGQRKPGFIKRVRPDGKLDLTLQLQRHKRDQHAKKIMDHLHANQGFVSLHDKSDPRLIEQTLGMSKGAFKRAVGGLYKEQVIAIEPNGIRLIEN